MPPSRSEAPPELAKQATSPSLRPTIVSVRPGASVRPRPTLRPFATVAALQGASVLVIDDDDMVRRSLVRVLRRKYAVTELRDCESALALIAAGTRFDAILCDLYLEGMSGRDFLLHLDAFHTEQAKRVVILSGSARNVMDDELLCALEARFLEKPASLAAIDAVVAGLVGERVKAA